MEIAGERCKRLSLARRRKTWKNRRHRTRHRHGSPALHHSNFFFETVDRDALLGRGSRVGSKAGRAGAVTLAASALALVMMASAKLS